MKNPEVAFGSPESKPVIHPANESQGIILGHQGVSMQQRSNLIKSETRLHPSTNEGADNEEEGSDEDRMFICENQEDSSKSRNIFMENNYGVAFWPNVCQSIGF